MSTIQPDNKPAKKAAQDWGEHAGLMEPLLISQDSRHRPALTDIALDLVQKSAGFRRSLPESLLASLADLVRSMNCYYSNLIEGHDTHPIDIERALKDDYSKDAKKRDLQLEAKAHIAVQQWIDSGGLRGRALTAVSVCEMLDSPMRPVDTMHLAQGSPCGDRMRPRRAPVAKATAQRSLFAFGPCRPILASEETRTRHGQQSV